MSSEQLTIGMEILVGAIGVPWVVFVTVSIFKIQTQLAVLGMKLDTLVARPRRRR